MTRREFLKLCAILGIAAPAASACGTVEGTESNADFEGRVLVIGAGIGGLSAGYALQQMGVDFEILEASNTYGGRVRIDREFADFSIPLGAEWIETGTGIFAEVVNDSSVAVEVETFADSPDRKFLNFSWLEFYEFYIVPSIVDRICYRETVRAIDWSGERIEVQGSRGAYTADRVIVSVPLKLLQDGDILFSPELPESKLTAISNVEVWGGLKAFFEFSESFFGDNFEVGTSSETNGEKLYYNAAFGQETSRNILGLFTVGAPAQAFTSRSGDELRDYILAELDEEFGGQATDSYLRHIVQNWSADPLARGAYLSDASDWQQVRELGRPVGERVFFGGTAYTDGEDWGSVHNAARSGKAAAIAAVNSRWPVT